MTCVDCGHWTELAYLGRTMTALRFGACAVADRDLSNRPEAALLRSMRFHATSTCNFEPSRWKAKE